MTEGSGRGGRLLHDGPARERLREAQQREAAAVAAVFVAQGALQRACAKRDAALASAAEVVDAAQDVVAAKQAALVKVSGVERAALLLGLKAHELRKALGRRTQEAGARTAPEQRSPRRQR